MNCALLRTLPSSSSTRGGRMDRAIELVLKQDEARSRVALVTVLKVVNNILSRQEEPKFRKLRRSNQAIMQKILDVAGAADLLAVIGFETVGDELVLPIEASMVPLVQARHTISAALAPPLPRAAAPHLAARIAPAAAPMAVHQTTSELSSDIQPMELQSPTATAPEMEDEELQAALALSQQVAPPAVAAAREGNLEDTEMKAAIALSLDQPDLSSAPSWTMDLSVTTPPAAAPAASLEMDELAHRVRGIFEELTEKGYAPNEAAALALKQASDEKAAAAAAVTPAMAAAAEFDLLSRQGFEARLQELFVEEHSAGGDASGAAARALQRVQKEQLAAANAKRAASQSQRNPTGERDAAHGAHTEPPAAESADASKERVVSFERLEDVEKVAQEQVEAINTMYREEGIVFVDPSFPPIDRSLYQSPESAMSWPCRNCKVCNPLPPTPSEEEAFRLLHDPARRGETIQCSSCGTAHTRLETALRPSGWRRPHELRDDVTFQYSDVPWVVFRDEPRPEDIRQGTVGNCWLVCALSCLAEEPANLQRIILTRDFNHAGAYQVRLCLAGEWHTLLIDDIFPTDTLNCLAYLKAARRSLWGPLIEKAAAKLHGSYEALNGGTFAEAFSMLSGYPVQRIQLFRYREPLPPPADAPEGAASSYAAALARWREKQLDLDELFGQIYSFRESGFVMGGSTYALARNLHEEAVLEEARAQGLQIPHAYCMMGVATVGDHNEQIVKLRNPNGHAGWRGRWGEGHSCWSYELKEHLKIDQEDKGVFWMAWSDFCKYFGEVTVCRMLPHMMEGRESGWLPSCFNAGQMLSLEAFARTEVELTLHQEPHRHRGVEGMATFVDIGLALLKEELDGSYSLVAHAERSVAAQVQLSAFLEQDAHSSRYLLLPLCFGHMLSSEPRKFRISVHSSQPLMLEKAPQPAALMGTAIIQIAQHHGEISAPIKHPTFGEMLKLYTLEEEAGYLVVAENNSPYPMRVEVGSASRSLCRRSTLFLHLTPPTHTFVLMTFCPSQVDASARTSGYLSSRGLLICQDVLPPRTRQLLIALASDMKSKTHSFSLQFSFGAMEHGDAGHIPSLSDLGALEPLHTPQPIVGTAGAAPQMAPPGDVESLASMIWNGYS